MTQDISRTTTTVSPTKTPSSTNRIGYATVSNPLLLSNFSQIASHMFSLMLRNVASDGWVFEDPVNQGQFSKPGCIIASPSFPANQASVDQNYVYNWTRDSAITAVELAARRMPEKQTLIDYVNFAKTCQDSGPSVGHACYTIEGRQRPWSEQSDGPASQNLAILHMYSQLDDATKTTAVAVMNANISYLLANYDKETTNLWEESSGYSFFARAVQLLCFRELLNNTIGLSVDKVRINAAITFLNTALSSHWDGSAGYYRSILNCNGRGNGLNADIIMASVYGAIDCTDTKLLASAARLRSLFADHNSSAWYPINGDDESRNIGPMIGRYEGDTYDGDVSDNQVSTDHPWAPCTANFAELYYKLAKAIIHNNAVPLDNISALFFSQVGINIGTSPANAAKALRLAGDKMLSALVYHSDHLELSEQFDGTTGFEKSVRNLTWSYAAFLSAVRAR